MSLSTNVGNRRRTLAWALKIRSLKVLDVSLELSQRTRAILHRSPTISLWDNQDVHRADFFLCGNFLLRLCNEFLPRPGLRQAYVLAIDGEFSTIERHLKLTLLRLIFHKKQD